MLGDVVPRLGLGRFRQLALTDDQNLNHPVQPSANLVERADCKECIVQSQDVQVFINILLALVHPTLYESATSCKALYSSSLSSDDQYISSLWKSVFQGIAVISNGTTKEHRDTKGHSPWYDVLVSLGNVSDFYLHLPELRAKITYNPRTVVMIAGHAITHSVEKWADGQERACWAFFLRRNVFERFNVPIPGWCYEQTFDRLQH